MKSRFLIRYYLWYNANVDSKRTESTTPAPLKEVAIKTLDLEIWSGNAKAITIADQLYGAVVELISNKIDTPVTCAGILDLQIRLMPSVRKFGDEMDEDDRNLLYNQLMSIEEVARRLKLQAAFTAPTEEALALTTRFLHFDPSTNAMPTTGGVSPTLSSSSMSTAP